MGDVAELVIDILKNALPYLLMSDRFHPLLAIGSVPVGAYAVRQLERWNARRPQEGYTEIIQLTRASWKVKHTELLTRVVWYLRDVIQLRGTYGTYGCVDVVGAYEDPDQFICSEVFTPYYLQSAEWPGTFDFEGRTITVCASQRERKEGTCVYEIWLSADCRETVDAFLRRVNSEFVQYVKKRNEAATDRYDYTVGKEEWSYKELKLNKTFDNVFLDPDVSAELRRDLDAFRDGEAVYRRRGIPYKRSYLLYGPPGTGKTSTGYAIANYLGYSIYHLDMSRVGNVAELEVLIRGIQPRSVVALDDFDQCGASRERVQGERDQLLLPPVTLANLLPVLDGYGCLYHTVMVCTTNHPERISPLLQRPGRMDRRFEIGLPGRAVMQAVFREYYERDLPEDIPGGVLSTSEIICGIVMPHRDSYEDAVGALLAATAERMQKKVVRV